MTRIEWDLMKANHPELKFPDWVELSVASRNLILRSKLDSDHFVKGVRISLLTGEKWQPWALKP